MLKRTNDRKSILITFASILLITIGFILVKVAVGEGFNQTVDSTIFTSRNLAVVESPYRYDIEYTQQYLNTMDNFSNIPFENLATPNSYSAIMKVRNVEDNIRAYNIANNNYAIHLLVCSASDFSCAFRINGVPTKKLREGGIFRLNGGYVLKINSITIDYCDGKRFCDLSYEAYDVVEVEIIKR